MRIVIIIMIYQWTLLLLYKWFIIFIMIVWVKVTWFPPHVWPLPPSPCRPFSVRVLDVFGRNSPALPPISFEPEIKSKVGSFKFKVTENISNRKLEKIVFWLFLLVSQGSREPKRLICPDYLTHKCENGTPPR